MNAGEALGYNAATCQYEDLTAAGIVDPCKVTRTALKNAVSVAVTFLSLDAVIFEDRNEKSPDQVE
jgi:chaperonin GroEL